MSTALSVVRLVRPHQWSKNLLVFVPLLAAHHWDRPDAWYDGLRAFVALCALASAVYAFNDWLDLESDRRHSHKRSRPFASGALAPWMVWPIGAVALAVAGWVAWPLSPLSQAMLLSYLVLTTAYSLVLKRMVWLDVFVLAGLYCLRILIGAAATDVAPSAWLLAVSGFAFFALGTSKRYTELSTSSESALPGRGYIREDRALVLSFGAASSVAAVIVLTLYISSEATAALYTRPAWIWLSCPALLYWFTRLWSLAARGELDHDPVVFAMRDPHSIGVACVVIGAFVLAL